MTDQELITNLIRRNATMRTLSRDVTAAHDSRDYQKLDSSVFALKEYLKAPVTRAGANEQHIRLWLFQDAPIEYRTRFQDHHKWEWLAFVPASLEHKSAEWPVSESFQQEGSFLESGDLLVALAPKQEEK